MDNLKTEAEMKKYGLQLRVQPSQQKKPARPPLPTPIGFQDDDDNDVEREISRQASKNKALKNYEEQHKKALEEDPSVFDYDGVYDKMKEKAAHPIAQDRQERKSKYIQVLIEKAKQREQEHEIIYERKLAKERSKEDHLYAGKDKFVTGAYKKRLAEQAKWMEEERLRQLHEEKEDVTKKTDLTDFYFNLSKNVAFGGGRAELGKPEKPQEEGAHSPERVPKSTDKHSDLSRMRSAHQAETSTPSPSPLREGLKPGDANPAVDAPRQEKADAEQSKSDQPRRDHHKRGEDALAAAKERFLARKKVKEQS